MSSIYNGNGTVPETTTGGSTNRAKIASSTDTTPIHVLFQSAQLWSLDGDTIRIEGHLTNVNANGLWQFLVVNSQEIVLVGSAGSGAGAGGATGYGIDLAVNPLLTIPSDGDLANGSSVNPAFEGLANLAPWLYERTGLYRTYGLYRKEVAGSFGPSDVVWSINTVPAAASSTVPAVYTMANSSGVIAGIAGGPLVAYNQDLFRLRWSFNILYSFVTTAPEAISMAIGASINGGGYAAITEYRMLLLPALTSAVQMSMTLESTYLNGSGNLPGTQTPGVTYDFCLICTNYDNTVTVQVNLDGGWSFECQHLRQNG